MSKLTLKEIAKLAGVSRSTVSRVVNNQPKVSAGVRGRVLKIIAETGYQPDPVARSLVMQRSGIIGLVIPRAMQSLFTDPYYPRLIQGIARACNANDYTLSLFLFHTADEEQKLYPRVLRTQLVDGVIVTGAQLDDPLIPRLTQNQVPFVVVGRPVNRPEVSFVDVDNVVSAYSAVSHLVRLGRERIATITGPLNVTVSLDRRQGYLDALDDRNLSSDDALIAEGDFTEEGGYSAMQRLLPHKPDAVFAASDIMAFGALRALREAGLSVPHDVAVVGFDDLPAAAHSDPPLTTIRQPILRTGIEAVEILVDILKNGPEPARHITLTTNLIIRSSCGSSQNSILDLHMDQENPGPARPGLNYSKRL
jgi:LacI family transcriptional regulator